MSTMFVCDWCGNETRDREKVAAVDFTIGSFNEKLHQCVSCAPDHLAHKFPDSAGNNGGDT